MSEHSRPTPSGTVRYDPRNDEPLTIAVVRAVAAATDTPMTELDPLYHAVDTDALGRLFEPSAEGVRAHGSVTFEYAGCRITVDADGEITVSRRR